MLAKLVLLCAVELVLVRAWSIADNIIVARDLSYRCTTNLKVLDLNSVGQRSSGHAGNNSGFVVFRHSRVLERSCGRTRLRWR